MSKSKSAAGIDKLEQFDSSSNIKRINDANDVQGDDASIFKESSSDIDELDGESSGEDDTDPSMSSDSAVEVNVDKTQGTEHTERKGTIVRDSGSVSRNNSAEGIDETLQFDRNNSERVTDTNDVQVDYASIVVSEASLNQERLKVTAYQK